MKNFIIRVIIRGQELSFPIFPPNFIHIEDYDNLIIKPIFSSQWDNLSKTISWTIENEDYRKVQFEDIISIPVTELKNRRFAFCFVGEDKEKILRITTNFLTVDLR